MIPNVYCIFDKRPFYWKIPWKNCLNIALELPCIIYTASLYLAFSKSEKKKYFIHNATLEYKDINTHYYFHNIGEDNHAIDMFCSKLYACCEQWPLIVHTEERVTTEKH